MAIIIESYRGGLISLLVEKWLSAVSNRTSGSSNQLGPAMNCRTVLKPPILDASGFKIEFSRIRSCGKNRLCQMQESIAQNESVGRVSSDFAEQKESRVH